MKKAISVCLALVLLLSAFIFPVFASEKTEIVLSNELAGLSWGDDAGKFAEIVSGDIVFTPVRTTEPLSVYAYNGDPYFNELKAGRTYYIDYVFSPAPGSSFPEKFSDETVSVVCGEGCTLLWYDKAVGNDGNGGMTDFLCVHTRVTVKGNTVQRIIGKLLDLLLKLRSWSLY